MNFFVVFVRTGGEDAVAQRMRTVLDKNEYIVFVPTKDYTFKKKGTITIKRVPLLGGYVFIATTHSENEAIQTVQTLARRDSAVFKLLSNDNDESFVLMPQDKTVIAAFLDILDDEFNLCAIPAAIVDGKIKILDNVLESYGGEVIKVNRNQQSAVVRLKILNRMFDCEIALEFCDEFAIRENRATSPERSGFLSRTSDVLRVGDMVEIVSGAMSGSVSEIVRFDWDSVVVEVEMFGVMREVKVGSSDVRVVVGV